MENDNGGVPRLAVPPIAHTECTHGTLNSAGYETTLFPQAITVARRQGEDPTMSVSRKFCFLIVLIVTCFIWRLVP